MMRCYQKCEMTFILSDWKVELAVLATLVLVMIYYKLTSIYSYFEKRGIPYIEGKFPFGSDAKAALLKTSVGLSIDEMYWKMKDKNVFGMYVGLEPFLVVREAEYGSKILIGDFEYFFDRNFIIDEKVNPLDAHLFFLSGNKWRMLRNMLSPIFTSGKIKFMYPEMRKCGDLFMEHFDKEAAGKEIDLKDLFGRFLTDVIASSAFGLEPESLVNPDNKFRKMGKKVFENTTWINIITFLRFAAPNLLLKLKIRTTPNDVHHFFIDLFSQVLNHRRESKIVRRDLVQLLLELKDKGSIQIDTADIEEKEKLEVEKVKSSSIEQFEITDLILTAQAFVFFLAGFETTSDCINYTIFLLSKNKEAQDKARREVCMLKEKFGDFTYDCIKEMTYLDNCITESTRIYPPVPMLNRMCVKDYTFPDGTKIEKGLNIILPIYSIQRDPKYYPDPEVFNPDRFYEPKGKGVYLPFGDGPRHCIGKRFSIVEQKMVLAMILDKYEFRESSLTKEPLEFKPNMPLSPSHPLYVKIVKINE